MQWWAWNTHASHVLNLCQLLSPSLASHLSSRFFSCCCLLFIALLLNQPSIPSLVVVVVVVVDDLMARVHRIVAALLVALGVAVMMAAAQQSSQLRLDAPSGKPTEGLAYFQVPGSDDDDDDGGVEWKFVVSSINGGYGCVGSGIVSPCVPLMCCIAAWHTRDFFMGFFKRFFFN
jgi:hypothetical protein